MTTIDEKTAVQLSRWFADGRNVILWTNQEIASDAPNEVFTTNAEAPPHWRYAKPVRLTEHDLIVELFDVVESFRGRYKAKYFGPWVAMCTENKAMRLCKKHDLTPDSWRWEFNADNASLVDVSIGKVKAISFIEWTLLQKILNSGEHEMHVPEPKLVRPEEK